MAIQNEIENIVKNLQSVNGIDKVQVEGENFVFQYHTEVIVPLGSGGFRTHSSPVCVLPLPKVRKDWRERVFGPSEMHDDEFRNMDWHVKSEKPVQ